MPSPRRLYTLAAVHLRRVHYAARLSRKRDHDKNIQFIRSFHNSGIDASPTGEFNFHLTLLRGCTRPTDPRPRSVSRLLQRVLALETTLDRENDRTVEEEDLSYVSFDSLSFCICSVDKFRGLYAGRECLRSNTTHNALR